MRRMMCRLIISFMLTIGVSTMARSDDLAQEFITKAEATDYVETSTYNETIDFIRRLEQASDLIKLLPIGATPQGRTMYVAVLSKDRAFTPEEAAATGKAILLVENGIHPGEIMGKEACLALMRDILITKKHKSLLDHVILLVVPVFNVDGHERTSPYNRANQVGPAEMGFRATAQRLNLNRDFLKADAPEMRAWIRMFLAWRPHLLIDNHVTDGADHQYATTYTITRHPNTPELIRQWSTVEFMPRVVEQLEKDGHKICQYVILKENDPSGGLWSWAETPRFSTGYSIMHNRPGMLVEMHMLKDFRTRVVENYALMLAVLEELNANPDALIDAVRAAEEETIAGLTEPYPLRFKNSGDSVMVDFHGYEYEYVQSDIAGTEWVRYFPDKPITMRIPYFNETVVTYSVIPPKYYLVPREWQEQLSLLALHGVELLQLAEPLTAGVELYRLTDPEWKTSSYEGRFLTSCKSETLVKTKSFPRGTVVVPLKQRAAKAAMQLLEPRGPDSFVSWGFFNTVFERKEYIEKFVIEPLAQQMLADDPELKAEFEARLAADSTFRDSPWDRWYFFYKRSLFYEPDLNLYPVARVMEELQLNTEPYDTAWRQ